MKKVDLVFVEEKLIKYKDIFVLFLEEKGLYFLEDFKVIYWVNVGSFIRIICIFVFNVVLRSNCVYVISLVW